MALLGGTLTQLAADRGISVTDLQKLNPQAQSNVTYTAAELNFPTGGTAAPITQRVSGSTAVPPPSSAPAPTYSLTPTEAQNRAALGGAPAPAPTAVPRPTGPVPYSPTQVSAFPGGMAPTTGQYAVAPSAGQAPAPAPAPAPTQQPQPPTTSYANNSVAQGKDFYKVLGPNGQVDVFYSNGQKVPDIGTFHQLGLNIDWIPFRQQAGGATGSAVTGTQAAAGSRYVRLAGTNAVFDISGPTPRYITAADAAKIPNFFSQVGEVSNINGLNKDHIDVIDRIVSSTGQVDIGKVNSIIAAKDMSPADLAHLAGIGTTQDAADAIGAAAAGAFATSAANPAEPMSPGAKYIANIEEYMNRVKAMGAPPDLQAAHQQLENRYGLIKDRKDIAQLKQDAAQLNGVFDKMRTDMKNDPDFIGKLKQRRLDFIDDSTRIALKVFDDKIKALEEKVADSEKAVADQFNIMLKQYELQSGLEKDQINMLMALNDRLDKANDNDRQWFSTIVSTVAGTAWDDLTPEQQKTFTSGFSSPGWEGVLKAAMDASYKSKAAELAVQKAAIAATNAANKKPIFQDFNGTTNVSYDNGHTWQPLGRTSVTEATRRQDLLNWITTVNNPNQQLYTSDDLRRLVAITDPTLDLDNDKILKDAIERYSADETSTTAKDAVQSFSQYQGSVYLMPEIQQDILAWKPGTYGANNREDLLRMLQQQYTEVPPTTLSYLVYTGIASGQY